MQRMVTHYLRIAVFAAIFCICATQAYAIDIAIPTDMFRTQVVVTDPAVGSYYYSAVSTSTDNGGQHSYLVTYDWNGNLVYYRKPLEREERLDVFLPVENQKMTLFSTGDVDESLGMIIMDSTFTPVDTIPHLNPHNSHFVLDAHEVLLQDDGSLYTTWRDTQVVDMSLYIPGGDPNALVCSHVIEHWDADHNLLWTWNGHDHTDQLPYGARIDSLALTFPTVEHLHVNSLDLFPDGDLLVSARHLSILFRVDRETGDVLWRFGGGPTNDFEIADSTGTGMPLDFNWQHDGRVLPNGNITVFDNGYYHTPSESYAREYHIEEDSLTADLTMILYQIPRRFLSKIHGSMRQYDDGHTLVGWGSITPDKHWQEFDENGDITFQLRFLPDMFNFNQVPRSYRVIRANFLPVAAKPYLSELVRLESVELYANWWGHEAEVASYDVYWGQTDPPPYYGNTTSGSMAIAGNYRDDTWFGRIIALDDQGNEISPWSETLVINQSTGVYVPAGNSVLPTTISLSPNWPNPFNNQTQFELLLPHPTGVDLSVYDMLGREVRTLYRGALTAGQHSFSLDAANLSSGMYLIRVVGNAGDFTSRRVTLVK